MAEGAREHLVLKISRGGKGGGKGGLAEGVVGGEGEHSNATAVAREVGFDRAADGDASVRVSEDVGGDATLI